MQTSVVVEVTGRDDGGKHRIYGTRIELGADAKVYPKAVTAVVAW
ncbi:MAG: hypothetical protein RR182_07460 [Alistipes sp.]